MAGQSNRAGGARLGGVAEYFGRLAPTYGDGEYYGRRRGAVLRAIEPELAAARRMLDLGCGNGRYLAEFARRDTLEMLAGADLSGEMLAQARRRAGARPHLVRASAEALPFKRAAFDLIFASHVLPFVGDLSSSVREIARLLGAGGSLVVTVGRGPVRDYLREVIPDAQWEALSRTAFARFAGRGRGGEGLEQHRAALSGAGLEVERRRAAFSVGWDGIAEWIRMRWLVHATDDERARAEEIIAAVPAAVRTRTFDITEELLIGCAPA
jgi:ubiquinone/menaquinone biosynthesis C-methylase UbiE